MQAKFLVGDKVWVEDSAREDLGMQAFWFIKDHPYATVKQRFEKEGVQEASILYALEWDEEFTGGWDVFGACKPGQGQQVTSKHLSLDFEGSRKAVTVPRFITDTNKYNISEEFDETGTTKNK